MKIKEWRRLRLSDTWHFMPRCSNWPTSGIVVRTKKPTSCEQCDQCRAKLRKATS